MEKNRFYAVLPGDGTIRLKEEPVPEVTRGKVRIKVARSLVSPGTEIKGWDYLAYERTHHKLNKTPKRFGYSVSGIVEMVGDGVEKFKLGDRVAAIGTGIASHATHVVIPQNLCIKLSDEETFDQGAYSMLMAVALQSVRRGNPALGEYWAVSGLGIIGLIACRLLVLNGCRVVGIDPHEKRLTIAREYGVGLAVHPSDPDIEEKIKGFTNQDGLDGAIVAFGGPAQDAMNLLVRSMKKAPDDHYMGTIVTVGWPEFDYMGEIGKMNNIDLRRSSHTGAGYHDPQWELGEVEYPSVFVRWTSLRNQQFLHELVLHGKLNVDLLTANHIPLMNVEKEIAKALDDSGNMLGVLFCNEV